MNSDILKGLKKIPHGGDYNPEQWPEEIWKKDMELFKKAGVDCLTLNIFSWASIQPSEEVYDFERLDRIVDLCVKNDMMIIMATSTAAHPAWMAKRHPDITRTQFGGQKRKFGDRHNSCPNSQTMKHYAPRLASKLAEHYKDCKNIIAWHVSNEYGGRCYCENCEKAFREYLQEKYQTIEALNTAWNANFWSHTFYDFDEIVVPDSRSEMWDEDHTTFPAITLDYWRFMSDAILKNYTDESDAIKEFMPSCPVTTNLMQWYKNLDYQRWAKKMDFTSWDSYPMMTEEPSMTSMWHDVIRSLKKDGSWILMEQTPSVTNWQPYCPIKRPGVTRLWSYRAIAHGAEGVLYFQMRRTRGACEKSHGAVIDHVGTENTRVFREVSQFGAELKKLGSETMGAKYPAEVGIVFDWDNWWDYELCAGPNKDRAYLHEVHCFYHALYQNHVAVDFVAVDDDLSKYKLLIAPSLFMVKKGFAEKINAFVENGGNFVAGFLSGMVDDTDLVYNGGQPGPLKDVLGIWVEETDALPPEEKNSFIYRGKKYESSLIFDIISEVKGNVLAYYEKDFYKGTPALTENSYGEGKAYYVATQSDEAFYRDFMKDLCEEAGIQPLWNAPEGVECTGRVKEDKTFYFLLNHSEESKEIAMEHPCVDLITDRSYQEGEKVVLKGRDLLLLKTL